MTTPVIDQTEPAVEVLDEADGEMRVRFPVVVIEGLETSDGRWLEPGGLSHRALPISLLAQAESAHGGDDPGAAVVIGRIDTLVRTPGPELISRRTGEPFPEGTFIWSGEGAIDATHPVAELVRRRFLRGVSVDLTGMDVEIVGDDQLADAEHPTRQMIAHAAEIAAVTLVPIPAFGDAYVELADEQLVPDPLPADALPEGLTAAAFPAWRSAEVGDPVAVVAAADPLTTLTLPGDAADQLAGVIDDGSGQQRDAGELAQALVDWMAANWADPTGDGDGPTGKSADPAPADQPAVTAAADEGPHTGGMIALVPADPAPLTVDGGLPAEELHLTLAYLGDDVTGWDADVTAGLVEQLRALAEGAGPVDARVMGHALFNPDGFDDREPCAVYLVGDAPAVTQLQQAVAGVVEGIDGVPAQHDPFTAHLTAGYGVEPSALSFTGPVVFDRLRVALGEDVTDLPLGAPASEPTADPGSAALAADPSPIPDPPPGDEADPAGGPETGMPDAPQPCFAGEHPAVRSLLFSGGEQYVATCADHVAEARAAIEAEGFTVDQEVSIAQASDQAAPPGGS